MPKTDITPCPSCGYKPAVLFSVAAGWVVMCLRYNCENPPRVTKPGKSRGDVVERWNEKVK